MLKEDVEQMNFISWIRYQYPKLLVYHIPNGGKRALLEAVKFKKMGVVSGIPDIHIPCMDLWIEMKRSKGGSLSKEQKKVIEILKNECGHEVIVGYGFEDAKEKFLKYASTYGGYVL